jgi:glutamate:GABA antiporter
MSAGAVGQIALLVFFTASVVLYGMRHGVHGISVVDLSPSRTVFIAIVPVLLYSFTGVELPSTAAEEMVDPRRDIPAAIFRAGIGQALMYGIPILAVLIVLPSGQITSLHGLIDAIRASQRGQFELLVLIPIAAVIAVTTAYDFGTRCRRTSSSPVR